MYETTPQGRPLSIALRTAVSALIMPLVFTAIPGWLAGDPNLLRLSWSVIAPSSLCGAMAVVFVPPLRQGISNLLRRVPKPIVALLGGASMVGFAFALSWLAALLNPVPTDHIQHIAFSAGAGGFATILTVFPNRKQAPQSKG